jgi:hypothetical protein
MAYLVNALIYLWEGEGSLVPLYAKTSDLPSRMAYNFGFRFNTHELSIGKCCNSEKRKI